MKRIETSVLLAGLLALGLSACSSTPTNGMASSSTVGSDSASSITNGSSNMGTQAASGTTTGSTGVAGAAGSTGAASTAGATASIATPNSTVTSIEVVPRQPGGAATGAGTVGSTAVGSSSTTGTTGSSMPADRTYRITLRMDDGRTRVVTQDWTPSFTSGDRVRIVSGAIQR